MIVRLSFDVLDQWKEDARFIYFYLRNWGAIYPGFEAEARGSIMRGDGRFQYCGTPITINNMREIRLRITERMQQSGT